MDGDFELNKPGWYTTQNVAPNDFLDDDQFGNSWYSVKFTGEASTYLWLAKEKPEENKRYYGHIERTKSGKALRFKRDTPPEEDAKTGSGGSKGWQPKNERQVTRNMVWKNLLTHFDLPSMNPGSKQWEVFWSLVDLHTDRLLGDQEKTKAKEEPDAQWSQDPIFDPETGARIG